MTPRSTSRTARRVAPLVAVCVSLIGATALAVAQTQAPSAGGAAPSDGPVVRVADNVTVTRPYGESGRDDARGFDGRPGFSRTKLPRPVAGRIALGPDGALWFVDDDGFVVRFDPASRKSKRFDTGGSTGEIATGNDGRIYVAVADPSGSQVTVMTPEGKKIRDVDVPFEVTWLQPSARGVWFASTDGGLDTTRALVGVIRPDGDVESAPQVSYPPADGPPAGAAVASAWARLSDGTVAAVDQRVTRLSRPVASAPDPLFQGLTGDEQFGQISDAVGGEDRMVYVLRQGQGSTKSTIWQSDGATAKPLVAIPDEALRLQFESRGTNPGRNFASVLRFGPDGKLWFISRVARSGPTIDQQGFLGRVEDPTHLTEWRMPWAAGDVDSAVLTDGMVVGIDGRIWFTHFDRPQILSFKVPDLRGWRSLKPKIVSAKKARDRAAVTISCVGQPGKLCFGTVWLTRGGKRVGSKLTYAVEAHAEGARPEIVRYLKLPKGTKSGLGVRLSNGARVALR